ncbi:uncharacterized protein KLLA0_D06193g [Kluyveromyces lactis]|uniref:KLLA0D06193p n=1 Tax=Kluyveromyces lactis (strain ATCC 8585 / CBS 2359 / DSM 70799 / NBRC 1267 / NRRL Y-1140 / WM37) TaxID=284590 RepID=Q6CRV1_KLULA|nr:uncharacterized protein KLLA0_D06193g [Kluyveromyces lactis]CAH00434.1 KLLA0D06193p [Kluyveromyces lactis]|eukprot:XP_453338.1 uncharacterized protein KLLA0_D06193g [Kluyveromyces lactis]
MISDPRFQYDNVLFVDDDDTSETVIFNIRSWYLTLVGILVKYGSQSISDATTMLDNSWLIKGFCCETYKQVCLYSHEYEYYWAMLVLHGDLFWRRGISGDLPTGYDQWEQEYIRANGLAESIFEFS